MKKFLARLFSKRSTSGGFKASILLQGACESVMKTCVNTSIIMSREEIFKYVGYLSIILNIASTTALERNLLRQYGSVFEPKFHLPL
jgi:hypothetical protein